MDEGWKDGWIDRRMERKMGESKAYDSQTYCFLSLEWLFPLSC